MINTILPTPKKIEIKEGTITVPSSVFTNHIPFKKYLDTFCAAFHKIYGIEIAKGEGIEVIFDPALDKDEYVFDSTNGIKLYASSEEGVSYAFATALQTLEVSGGRIISPVARIEDRPDKPYRALMVDLVRQWHPVRNVLKYIDVCFMLKLHYIHLHIIDDQRYTLPSKAFPNVSSNPHYSYDDIKTIREYASARGIVIIPEFEAPGHAAALNAAYPEVFGNDLKDGACAQFVTDEGDVVKANRVICAGKKATIDGIRALLTEMCELFPDSPFIHIGGDEANIKAWDFCPDCQKYMKENNISDVYELYSDVVARVAKMALELGRTPIVWEGFPQKGAERIPKETIVIAWESLYHLAPDLLKAGFKIINASWQPLYIVDNTVQRWGPLDIMRWNIYNWQNWWEKSKAYLNPITVEATDDVLGAQICHWNGTFEQSINFVMENCAALSERTWNVKRLHTDAEFLNRHKPTVKLIAALIQDV